MKLLDTSGILESFTRKLNEADTADIAVAWAGAGQPVDEVVESAKRRPGRIRAIVGLYGNASNPEALDKLKKTVDLRLWSGAQLFHPKVYVFRRGPRTTCWVGSANLTNGGFGKNVEVLAEFEDSALAVEHWFEEQWRGLPADCGPVLASYTAKWRPPKPPPAPNLPSLAPPRSLPKVFPKTWDAYIRALELADAFWGRRNASDDRRSWNVLGDEYSWLNTIAEGRLLTHRPSWRRLSYRDYRLFMGIEIKGEDDGFGLLGSMWAAGRAKTTFLSSDRSNAAKRSYLREALEPVLTSDDRSFPLVAARFISAASSLDGISGAVATRFLALARPDQAISVNSASRDRLAEIAGLKASTLSRPKNYQRLLEWFSGVEWYASPTPRNSSEEIISRARAALVDALVYEPRSGR